MAKVTTIPATISRFTATPINEKKKRRTAAYARVSTDSEEQLTSYSAQVDYYTNYIKSRDDWDFVSVYTDEGITGTNTKHREGFKRMVADALADFSRDEHLMSLKYVAGRSGRVVMTEELLPAPIPASKAALREVILPLLDESDEPFDDDNLIDYGLDSVRMMALAARWRKVHGDIDFVMLAKNPTIDAWWKLLSREVK